MNYTGKISRQWFNITKSNVFYSFFYHLDFENVDFKDNSGISHKLTDVLYKMADKDIEDFSKIKVNIERKKIDKYVPNRYIPKIKDNNKTYNVIETIAKDELKYIQYANNQYEKNHHFDESKNTKLNSIRADVFKQEAIFKDMIFKGIKSDIETIGLYRHEPEKTNLKAINNAEIEEKLVCQALTDISNFTGQNHCLINSQINEIYNNNNKITRNQKQIDKIGFWKGNFFGTKHEKQQYSILKINNNDLQKSSDEIYNSIKDKIDKTIHLSSFTAIGTEFYIPISPINFEDKNFANNASEHANTELELKDIVEDRISNGENAPQFLMDRNFVQNLNDNYASGESIISDENLHTI